MFSWFLSFRNLDPLTEVVSCILYAVLLSKKSTLLHFLLITGFSIFSRFWNRFLSIFRSTKMQLHYLLRRLKIKENKN